MELRVIEYAQHWAAFVGPASVAEVAQTEPAIPQGKLLYLENTARRMRKNTRLGVGFGLPRQSAQPLPAEHILRAAG